MTYSITDISQIITEDPNYIVEIDSSINNDMNGAIGPEPNISQFDDIDQSNEIEDELDPQVAEFQSTIDQLDGDIDQLNTSIAQNINKNNKDFVNLDNNMMAIQAMLKRVGRFSQDQKR